jgi:AraC family transcriptional regulator
MISASIPKTRNVFFSSDDRGLAVDHAGYPPGFRQANHMHARASLTLTLRGSFEEKHGRACELAMPLSVVIKRPGVLHADVYGPDGCENLQIRLPEDMELEEILPEEGSLKWHHRGGPAVAAFLSFAELLAERPRPGTPEIEFALHDVIAAIGPPTLPGGVPPRWLMRTKEHLDDSLPTAPPTLKQLGLEAGVHPVHLTRAFNRYFGCSVRAYLKGRRSQLAALHLARGSHRVTDVAHRLGFFDHPHLCRDFRSFASMSPKDFHALVRKLGATTG